VGIIPRLVYLLGHLALQSHSLRQMGGRKIRQKKSCVRWYRCVNSGCGRVGSLYPCGAFEFGICR
jgi:hypothetical protein